MQLILLIHPRKACSEGFNDGVSDMLRACLRSREEPTKVRLCSRHVPQADAGLTPGASAPGCSGCGFVVHPVESVLDEFGGILEVELALDVLAVGFHRADAQMEFPGDLASAAALPDHAKNLELAVREAFDRVRDALGATGARELLEH